jgi:acetoacetate decarboxylase
VQTKRIPRADGEGYDVDQVIRNELRDPKVHASRRGAAALYLGGSPVMDPLFELEIDSVLGAEFVVADFVLDYGSVYEDRLAASRGAAAVR